MENSLIGNVDILHVQASLDPFRQLFILTRPRETAICHYHQSIIVLSSHNSSQTLGALSHCIKLEELVPVSYLFAFDHKSDPLQKNWIM